MTTLAEYDVRLPCGTSSARTNHLAHGYGCTTCGVDGPPDPRNNTPDPQRRDQPPAQLTGP